MHKQIYRINAILLVWNLFSMKKSENLAPLVLEKKKKKKNLKRINSVYIETMAQ
jgi:hypothetical protein